GTAGGAASLKGSSMGDPGETHCPVVPPLNPEGAIVGAPATAKSDPVKFGPPLLRSIVPPPVQPAPPVVAAAQPELFEFTTMPRTGPPTTATVALPLTSRAWPQVGFSTMIGPGPGGNTNPQRATACTSWYRDPVTSPAKNTGTRSATSTCMNGKSPAIARGAPWTPAIELRKLIETSFEAWPAVRPGLR